MNVLKILEDLNISLPYKIYDKLGEGADGQALLIENNRVLKLAIYYEYNENFLVEKENIFNCLNYLKNNKDLAYNRIYDVVELASSFRKKDNFIQRYVVYYYIMDYLFPLSNDEKRLFNSISNYIGYDDYMLSKTATDLFKFLWVNKNKVLEFLDNYNKSQICHLDIHDENIMKDKDGNFKLIDFDRLAIGE